MTLLYNLTVAAVHTSFRVASLFHPKAKQFVTGRKDVISTIRQRFSGNNDKVVWIHCASLGEFEQGRPIIEAVRSEFPKSKVVVTFFSPSGYEVRKNFPLAEFVTYLPMDSKANARAFIDAINPSLVIFVKYEFWYHYSQELKKRNIPLLSVSSIFRKDQFFFHPLGGFYRRILSNFSHFFVQNERSQDLLKRIKITNVTIAGDTRFDRVHRLLKSAEPIPLVEKFKANQKVFVVGSCWPEDMEALIPLINENRLKFIIAPHEVSESSVTMIEKSLQVKSIRYSQAEGRSLDDATVLIIDNMGMLSRLYRYGEFAYVGGAFGKGLHNILEAACYGIPILFGNKNYEKFQEAVDLINRGGAFEVSDYPDLKAKYEMLNNPQSFLLACEVTKQYVIENLGATEKIMNYCRPLLTR